jgi:hypothetical protein
MPEATENEINAILNLPFDKREEILRTRRQEHRLRNIKAKMNDMMKEANIRYYENQKKAIIEKARARLGPDATELEVIDETMKIYKGLINESGLNVTNSVRNNRRNKPANVPRRNNTNKPANVPRRNNTTQKTSTAHWHQPVKAKSVKKSSWFKFF